MRAQTELTAFLRRQAPVSPATLDALRDSVPTAVRCAQTLRNVSLSTHAGRVLYGLPHDIRDSEGRTLRLYFDGSVSEVEWAVWTDRPAGDVWIQANPAGEMPSSDRAELVGVFASEKDARYSAAMVRAEVTPL